MNAMQGQPKALQGIRILDFSHVFQGPVATQLLADFGADVIKIERPGSGDWSRSWGPYVDGVSMPFANLNRNKRCLAVNMKDPRGKDIILALVRSADVLVHNFRAGVMEKLGLGYQDLREENPRMVYAASSGWGENGPYAERKRAGHDLMARAEGGWFTQSSPDARPSPAGMSVDYPAGLMLAQGILLALLARTQTGCGQYVTTDLLSVAFHAHAWEAAAALNAHRLGEHEGIGATEQLIEKAFKTRDGWIEISPVFSDDALRDIAVALGLHDLLVDSRFVTPEDRWANRALINDRLGARFIERSTDEWIADLEPKGVLCAKIRTFTEAASDPQILANQMVIEMEHPTAGPLRLLGTPLRLQHTPASHRLPPARTGAHNAAILGELGYSDEEIASLEGQGVIGS
jgi:crotonobetainyl-CoA:carnitine CoA-transferase CaiB-like acyl-CoA transferase